MTESKKHYQNLASIYEALNSKEDIFKEKPFFTWLLGRYDVSNCLDCACGTGWHLFMLDELGIKAFGSDLSTDMLAVAERNLFGKDVVLKQEDFRTLDQSWHQDFDLVICMTSSLAHMLSDDDVLAALQSMHQVLKPGGVLVISNGISDQLLDTKPKFMPARISSDYAFYFFFEYPHPEQIVFHTLYVTKIPDSFAHHYEAIRLNAMRKSTLDRCFSQTQFSQVKYYGDYELSTYSEDTSSRLIVIAEK